MAISITAAHEAVEVDLWGALFYTQRITRTRQKQLTAIGDEIEALKEADTVTEDDVVALWARLLDRLLAPAEGKRKKASAHIVEKWHADDLTMPELESFIERLTEAARPT